MKLKMVLNLLKKKSISSSVRRPKNQICVLLVLTGFPILFFDAWSLCNLASDLFQTTTTTTETETLAKKHTLHPTKNGSDSSANDEPLLWKPLRCEEAASTKPNIPGVTATMHPNSTIITQESMFYSKAWGNVLSPYWAARVYAELGGYRYTLQGSLGHGEWMQYLPTKVEKAKPPRKQDFAQFCTCRHARDHSYEYFHGCNYGWAETYQTIRNDTRAALDRYMKDQPAAHQHKVDQVLGLFQPQDWLVYDRCQIMGHNKYGFGTLSSTYTAIPSNGALTVYTLSPTHRNEHLGLCPQMHALRDHWLRSRNPRLQIVHLNMSSDLWIDFARLVYAPNVLIPTAGSSWVLWAVLANAGNVWTVPHLGGGVFGDIDLSIYDKVPNLHVLSNATVIYKPDLHPPSAMCLGFDEYQKNNAEHHQRILDCFQSNFSIASLPASKRKRILVAEKDDVWPSKTLISSIADRLGRVVVSMVNCAYTDMADNFAASLERLGVTNYVFVALDGKAYSLLSESYPDNSIPPMPSIQQSAAEAVEWPKFGPTVTFSRPTVLQAFLEQGWTVFYNDVDIVWQQNVWTEFFDPRMRREKARLRRGNDNEDDYDYEPPLPIPTVLQVDAKTGSGHDNFCTGILYLEPHIQNRQLLEEWKKAIATEQYLGDQDAFKAVMKQPLGGVLRFDVNPRERFQPGHLWKNKNHSAIHDSLLLHSNYLVGKDAKIERFRNFDLWKPSGRFDPAKLELCRK